MHNYMKALYHRFEAQSERAEKLEREADHTYKQLTKQLGKHQRRLLLHLVDLEAALRDQSCLDSFISGYRVAHGIYQELLADRPPYNFENEDERLSCERIQTEKQEVN